MTYLHVGLADGQNFNGYGDLDFCSPVFGNPESKVIGDLDITDHIVEFDKTNSEHGILIIENRRDDSRPNLWRKICSVPKYTNVENKSISFRHPCKSSSLATGCSSLVIESRGDSTCLSTWCKIRSILRYTNIENQSISLEFLCKSSSLAASCSCLAFLSVRRRT